MTKDYQKDIEINHASSLLSILGIETDSLRPASTDPPDLLFELEGKQISLEHSILMTEQGQSVMRDLASFNKLIEEVQKLYDPCKHGIIRVWVTFIYGKKLAPRPVSIQDVAKELLNICVKYNPGKVGGFYDNTVPKNDLPPYASNITIWGSDNAGSIGFSRNTTVISGSLPLESLADAINNKERKLSKYKANYHENWLLLVADGSQASQFADFKPDGIEKFQNSKFDHIYILEYHTKQMHQLKLVVYSYPISTPINFLN
ncbi:hypothetical protein GYB22_11920 [bacterium]|nr:hypothetical protein [bacterium]